MLFLMEMTPLTRFGTRCCSLILIASLRVIFSPPSTAIRNLWVFLHGSIGPYFSFSIPVGGVSSSFWYGRRRTGDRFFFERMERRAPLDKEVICSSFADAHIVEVVSLFLRDESPPLS